VGADDPFLGWKPGDCIVHPIFGRGMVVQCATGFLGPELTIGFDLQHFGTKTLVLQFAASKLTRSSADIVSSERFDQ